MVALRGIVDVKLDVFMGGLLWSGALTNKNFMPLPFATVVLEPEAANRACKLGGRRTCRESLFPVKDGFADSCCADIRMVGDTTEILDCVGVKEFTVEMVADDEFVGMENFIIAGGGTVGILLGCFKISAN